MILDSNLLYKFPRSFSNALFYQRDTVPEKSVDRYVRNDYNLWTLMTSKLLQKV